MTLLQHLITRWHLPNHLRLHNPGLVATSALLVISTLEVVTARADTPALTTTASTAASLPDTSALTPNGTTGFASSDPSWVSLLSNSYSNTFATHAKRINKTVIYTEQSQLVTLYNTNEDLSQARYQVTNPETNKTVASGQFQRLTIAGKAYYALCLSNAVIQASFEAEQTAHVALQITIQNGSKMTAPVREVAVQVMAGTASVTLSPIDSETTINGAKATLVDANDHELSQVPLTKADLIINSDHTYQLSPAGLQKVQVAVETYNQTVLTAGGLYHTLDTLAASAAKGTITTQPTTSAATLTVTYVDDDNHRIKTEVITGTLGKTGTYVVKLPAGYDLATGQSDQLSYTLTQSDHPLIVRLTHHKDSAKSAATLTINYTDSHGHIVTTHTMTGVVGETGTYTVKPPTGYDLAEGQPATGSYTLSKPNTTITVRIQQSAGTSHDQSVTTTEPTTTTRTDHSEADSPSTVPSPDSAQPAPVIEPATTQPLASLPVNQPLSTSIPERLLPSLPSMLTDQPEFRAAKPTGSRQQITRRRTNRVTRQATTAQADQKRTVHQAAAHQASVTVTYLDGTTQHPLATEVLTGHQGDRIVFDTYRQILPWQQRGYYVTTDETSRLTAAHFGTGPSTYTVVLRQRSNSPANHSQVTPAKSAGGAATTRQVTPATPSPATAQQAPSSNTEAGKHRRNTSTQRKHDQATPVVMDPEIQAMLSPTGPAGGRSDLGVSELGQFFISLAGTINFGIQPTAATNRD